MPHTLSVIEKDARDLRALLNDMSSTVRSQLSRMLEALRRNDTGTLAAVIEDDAQIDALHAQISMRGMRLLARNQPVARDLREVLAGQRVSLELERIGDHIKRIAKRRLNVVSPLPAEIIGRLLWFGGQVQTLVSEALRTYQDVQAEGVEQVWKEDAQIDRLYQSLLAELLERMRQHSDWVEIGVNMVLVVKSLERIGDHATNIAEEARFIALGEVVQAREITR